MNNKITPLPDGGHKLELLSEPKPSRVLTDKQLAKIVSHPETDESPDYLLRFECERMEYERNSAQAMCELMAGMLADTTGHKPLTFAWQEDDA